MEEKLVFWDLGGRIMGEDDSMSTFSQSIFELVRVSGTYRKSSSHGFS